MAESPDRRAGNRPDVSRPFRVCADCYEALERYAAYLRNTLRLGQAVAQATDYPPAPELCDRCRTAMAELRAIYVAKDDSGFRFGV